MPAMAIRRRLCPMFGAPWAVMTVGLPFGGLFGKRRGKGPNVLNAIYSLTGVQDMG